MQQSGWTGATGADADHLKTRQDIRVTFEAGFTFFTIDPSEHVDAHADDYDEATLRAKYAEVAERVRWVDRYRGKQIALSTRSLVELTEEACLRAAVKYGLALQHALELGQYIAQLHEPAGRDYEIELSVDETEQPTTLAEHYIVADQCLRGGMKLVSLAPRFRGRLREGCGLQGPPHAAGMFAARSCGDRRTAGAVQVESAFGIGQAVDVSRTGSGHARSFPRQDGRHKLPGGAARRGPPRSCFVSRTDQFLPPAVFA